MITDPPRDDDRGYGERKSCTDDYLSEAPPFILGAAGAWRGIGWDIGLWELTGDENDQSSTVNDGFSEETSVVPVGASRHQAEIHNGGESRGGSAIA